MANFTTPKMSFQENLDAIDELIAESKRDMQKAAFTAVGFVIGYSVTAALVFRKLSGK
jgi:hypothetical protein